MQVKQVVLCDVSLVVFFYEVDLLLQDFGGVRVQGNTVVAIFDSQVFGAFNGSVQVLSVLIADHLVAVAVHDEGGHFDLRQTKVACPGRNFGSHCSEVVRVTRNLSSGSHTKFHVLHFFGISLDLLGRLSLFSSVNSRDSLEHVRDHFYGTLALCYSSHCDIGHVKLGHN